MDPSVSKGASPPRPYDFDSQQPSGAPPPQPIYAQASGAPPPQHIYTQNSGTPPSYGQDAEPPSYAEALTYPTQTGMTYPGKTTSQSNAYTQPIMTQPMTNAYRQPMVLQNQDGQVLYAYTTTVIYPNSPEMNENPVKTKCPECQAEITTSTEYVVGGCTILFCIMFGAMGIICCCIFPFFWNGSKDVVHTCPICKAEVGRFLRMQPAHNDGIHRRRRVGHYGPPYRRHGPRHGRRRR